MKSFKKSIRKARAYLRYYQEWICDAKRYRSSAIFGAGEGDSFIHIEAKLTRTYHVLEKGLGMPEFRPRFGARHLAELERLLVTIRERFPEDGEKSSQVRAAVAAIGAYRERHRKLGVSIDDLLPIPSEKEREYLEKGEGGVSSVGCLEITKQMEFSRFVKLRRSIRDFEASRVPRRELIEEALEIAVGTPSVCNRQSWRLHVFEGEKAQAVLKHQGGNRGFGESIPLVSIVTADMRCFGGVIERYQPWIDGGMFSMTLLFALHSLGLGAVPLNWSVNNQTDAKLRETANIPAYERIIMLIGCGYPKEGALSPISKRKSVAELIRWA